MTTPIVYSSTATDDERHHVRLIRNDCRQFLTRTREEITAAQQDEWWETDARKAMDVRLWWTTGGLPIGYSVIQELDGRAWLTGCVIGGWRGKGIGRKIFETLTTDVLETRDEVWLDVLETNAPARALYESLGFEYAERSADDSDNPIDVLVMVKRK